MRKLLVVGFLILLAVPVFAAEEPPRAAARPLATMHITPDTVSWEAEAEQGLELAVAGPDGAVLRRAFAAGETPSFTLFDEGGQRLPDGVYTYELRAVRELRPGRSLLLSGSLAIRDGSFVEPAAPAERPDRGPKPVIAADQVIADDLIVQGNACIGLECANGESMVGLEIKHSTPAITFEDTGGGLSGTHDWLILANGPFLEESFKVLDLDTSTTPFTLTGGAPTHSLFVSSTGNVGLGTSTPGVKLHLHGSSGTTKLLVEETNGTQIDREMFELSNNGNVAIGFENRAVTQRWAANVGTTFRLNEQTNAGIEFTLTNVGNLTIAGTLTENSDRTTKTDLSLVDPEAVLAKVDALPVMTWRRIGDQALHMGPMAQDFATAFGLGEDDRHVSAIDLAGASLAAIQGLLARLEELESENAALTRRLERIEKRAPQQP